MSSAGYRRDVLFKQTLAENGSRSRQPFPAVPLSPPIPSSLPRFRTGYLGSYGGTRSARRPLPSVARNAGSKRWKPAGSSSARNGGPAAGGLPRFGQAPGGASPDALGAPAGLGAPFRSAETELEARGRVCRRHGETRETESGDIRQHACLLLPRSPASRWKPEIETGQVARDARRSRLIGSATDSSSENRGTPRHPAFALKTWLPPNRPGAGRRRRESWTTGRFRSAAAGAVRGFPPGHRYTTP